MSTSTAWRYASTSKVPLGANFSRFRLARLQAESSRNMYSLHGLLALILAVFLEVCQRFTVVSNCMPGSPQRQVASEILKGTAGADRFGTEVGIAEDGVHEVIRDADGVVGVLKKDR